MLIDYWVFETACRQLKSWKDKKRAAVLLSINVSAKSFETKDYANDLIALVRKYEVDPNCIQAGDYRNVF